MKASLSLVALALAGCGQIPGSTPPEILVSLPPAPIHLTKVNRFENNGKLSGVDFEWDLGGREYRRIDCAGVSSVSGIDVKGPLTSILKVSFRAVKDGSLSMKIDLDQRQGNQHTSSATESSVRIVGGVSGVTLVPEEKLSQTAKSITLLSWKSADRSTPPALKIEFR